MEARETEASQDFKRDRTISPIPDCWVSLGWAPIEYFYVKDDIDPETTRNRRKNLLKWCKQNGVRVQRRPGNFSFLNLHEYFEAGANDAKEKTRTQAG